METKRNLFESQEGQPEKKISFPPVYKNTRSASVDIGNYLKFDHTRFGVRNISFLPIDKQLSEKNLIKKMSRQELDMPISKKLNPSNDERSKSKKSSSSMAKQKTLGVKNASMLVPTAAGFIESPLLTKKSKSSNKKIINCSKNLEKEQAVMRTYMKIHNIKHGYNKDAIDKLKSKVDSDGEELSIITSEEEEEELSVNDSIILNDAEEANILQAVTELNTE
ncbi:unnamed protein product [Moneuplotes crassus]|uniref:Uncharacterized protein n=1 Tax=Euplotes crassus TaxID=5936 RepID=A0AAD1UGJ9_EUPCR|nr:unnamed protein product [Moneuplotes crassus]